MAGCTWHSHTSQTWATSRDRIDEAEKGQRSLASHRTGYFRPSHCCHGISMNFCAGTNTKKGCTTAPNINAKPLMLHSILHRAPTFCINICTRSLSLPLQIPRRYKRKWSMKRLCHRAQFTGRRNRQFSTLPSVLQLVVPL